MERSEEKEGLKQEQRRKHGDMGRESMFVDLLYRRRRCCLKPLRFSAARFVAG